MGRRGRWSRRKVIAGLFLMKNGIYRAEGVHRKGQRWPAHRLSVRSRQQLRMARGSCCDAWQLHAPGSSCTLAALCSRIPQDPPEVLARTDPGRSGDGR